MAQYSHGNIHTARGARNARVVEHAHTLRSPLGHGTNAGADTCTRPIMFASPPNQICRLARSNTMCRMVFGPSAVSILVRVTDHVVLSAMQDLRPAS